MAEYKSLHKKGKPYHHKYRHQDRGQGWNMPTKVMNISAKGSIDQVGKWHLTFHNANKGQGGKQRHNTLGKVENARRFVDQDKAQRDQGVKHPCHQTVKDNFGPVEQISRHFVPLSY